MDSLRLGETGGRGIREIGCLRHHGGSVNDRKLHLEFSADWSGPVAMEVLKRAAGWSFIPLTTCLSPQLGLTQLLVSTFTSGGSATIAFAPIASIGELLLEQPQRQNQSQPPAPALPACHSKT